MPNLTTDELLEVFKGMTLLELTDFSKKFETTFEVTAAPPITVVQGPPEEPEAVEQTEFDVTLDGAGDRKIFVIKVVRELTKLGLKEAKDLVDAAPKLLLSQVDKMTADAAVAKLDAAGAITTIT